MANYESTTRTNWFRVTDEDAYKTLLDRLFSNGEIYAEESIKNGVTLHCLTVDGELSYYDGEECIDIDEFYFALSEIIPEDDACILIGSGHEKLRYFLEYAFVITKNSVDFVDLETAAVEMARLRVGKKFETQF